MSLLRTSLLSALLSTGLLAIGSAQAATTYFVRTDGGDTAQCTGRSDAPYPGSGTNQACAWKHPFYALPPGGKARIAGGDTLMIGGGSYMMGQGAPGAGSCGGASCYMAAIPSGTSSAKTRILGKAGSTPVLWGTVNASRVLNLQSSNYVEVGNLEVTDHNDCVYSHSQSTANCKTGGTWARVGLYATNSSNVYLHDLNIHGLAHMGMNTGALSNWTMERVKINKNGRAGWDASAGGDASSNSGAMILRNLEVAWNGCGERWQTGEVWACWAQQTGGYGDGIGTYYTGGQWLVEDSYIHHNTSDGLDLRYMDGEEGTTVTVRRLYSVANAGNQAKIRGNAVIENSVLVSNCAYFRGRYYMVEGDLCRASGNTLQFVPTSSDVIVARNNTITGEGGVLIGAIEGDSSSTIAIQNNVLIGFPRWDDAGTQSSAYYANNAPAKVTWTKNLVWKVKSNTCPADSVCTQDPKLKNMTLASFDATPTSGSPVIDKGQNLSDLKSDFLLQPRPSGAATDIGAYEFQTGGTAPAPSPTPTPAPAPAPTCTRAKPTLSMTGTTTQVAAGTTNSYTITLKNNDSASCSNTAFQMARTVPTGWTGTLGASSLTLAPGASASTTLKVVSPTSAAAGTYGIAAGTSSSAGSTHTASASSTYAVKAAVATGLTESLSTSQTSYTKGSTVKMTARVMKGGVAVKNARVQFTALKPNKVNKIITTAYTDSNGYATSSWASGTGPSSIGTYQLTSVATSGTLTAKASTSFSVK